MLLRLDNELREIVIGQITFCCFGFAVDWGWNPGHYNSSSLSYIPSPRGSLGHHRWFCNQFPPSFPVLHCPLGLCKLQVCPFPSVVFPPLPLSALSSSPSHCTLRDGFGQTWWTGDIIIPLQFASLYNGLDVFVWSDCLLDLARTSSLVTWFLYKMRNILR